LGNDSWTHRDELDLTTLTKSATEIVEGNEDIEMDMVKHAAGAYQSGILFLHDASDDPK